MGAAGDRRADALAFLFITAFESAAGNAGLDPGLAWGELAVGGQARELGAGAGAAGERS